MYKFNYKLNKEELKILEEIERKEWISVENENEMKEILYQAALNTKNK